MTRSGLALALTLGLALGAPPTHAENRGSVSLGATAPIGVTLIGDLTWVLPDDRFSIGAHFMLLVDIHHDGIVRQYAAPVVTLRVTPAFYASLSAGFEHVGPIDPEFSRSANTLGVTAALRFAPVGHLSLGMMANWIPETIAGGDGAGNVGGLMIGLLVGVQGP